MCKHEARPTLEYYTNLILKQGLVLMDLHGQKQPKFLSTEAIFTSEGLGFFKTVMHPQLIDQNAL